MTDPLQELIRQHRRRLENPYAFLDGDGGYVAALPQSGLPVPSPTGEPTLRIDPEDLLSGKKQGDRFSPREIEAIARRLQRILWKHRSRLCSDDKISPVHVLEPSKALATLGFEVIREDSSLGDIEVGGEHLGVAGLLDRDNFQIRISPRCSGEAQRFTLAHELGHVVLHSGSSQHRDRALDGSAPSGPLSAEEREADIFAAAFLMPEKQVRLEFARRFITVPFVLSDDAAVGLGDTSSPSAQRPVPRHADLDRRLASATYFHGAHFPSLAQHFQVSEAAMAIRIRELGLVAG